MGDDPQFHGQDAADVRHLGPRHEGVRARPHERPRRAAGRPRRDGLGQRQLHRGPLRGGGAVLRHAPQGLPEERAPTQRPPPGARGQAAHLPRLQLRRHAAEGMQRNRRSDLAPLRQPIARGRPPPGNQRQKPDRRGAGHPPVDHRPILRQERLLRRSADLLSGRDRHLSPDPCRRVRPPPFGGDQKLSGRTDQPLRMADLRLRARKDRR